MVVPVFILFSFYYKGKCIKTLPPMAFPACSECQYFFPIWITIVLKFIRPRFFILKVIQVFLSIIVRKYCNIFRVHMWFHAQLAQKYWMVSIAHKMRWTNQLVTLENQGPTVFWRLNRGSTWEFLPVCHKALLEPCYWPVYLKVKIFTIGALYTPQRLGYNAPRPPRSPPFWFPGNVRVKPHFNTQCPPPLISRSI